jgi:ligand-binding sensor domain-containing protein
MLRFFLICVLQFFAVFTFSQELPPLKNFSPSDYEAGNQNWAITQDHEGQMYFANNSGLLKFNGAQWELYDSPNGSILRSAAFIDGRVYTGMYMDFGFWEQNPRGELEYFSLLKNSNVLSIEDEQFWKIVDSQNYILFQSLNAIYTFDKTTLAVKRIVESPNIWRLFQVEKSLYYQVLGEGLFQIRNGKGELVDDSEFLKSSRVQALFIQERKLSFLTDHGIISSINSQSSTLNLQNVFAGLKIYSAAVLDSGELILGTVSRGLIVLNKDYETDFELDKIGGLNNNTVLSVFQDRDSNIWCGLDNGTAFLNLDSHYRIYTDKVGKLGTIYDSKIHEGRIYIASNQGVFVKNHSSRKSDYQLIPNTAGQAWNLDLIDERLYCSHDDGLFLIEGRTAESVFSSTGVWKVKWINNLDKEAIILGTYNGLYTMDTEPESQDYQIQKIEGFNISSRDFEFFENSFFVNHEYKGVFQLQVNKSLDSIIHLKQRKDIIKTPKSDIALINPDELFFSNEFGIYKYNTDTDEFTIHQDFSDVIINNGYSSGKIISTEDGSKWLFTRSCLLQLNRQEIDGKLIFKKYQLPQYVRNEMPGYENVTSLEEDLFLVGTAKGYILINTSTSLKRDHEVRISKVYATDKKGNTQTVVKNTAFPNSTNTFTLELHDSSYEALLPTMYQYRVDGLQDYWSEWQDDSSIQLKNIPHGDYNIEIRSQQGSNVSQNIAGFTFTVEKPFYASSSAIALYTLLLGLSILAVNLFYRNYYKRKKAVELENQQRELELVQLASQNEMSELRNEKLRDEIKYRNNELAVSTMGMLRKNEALTEISNAVKKLPQSPEIKKLKKLVDKNLTNKQEWISFEEAFNNADKDFFKKLKSRHNDLTTGDLRLCTYLRLNLSSKEIAPLLNISPRSVEIKRYRLRKKLGLAKEDNLTDYILGV